MKKFLLIAALSLVTAPILAKSPVHNTRKLIAILLDNNKVSKQELTQTITGTLDEMQAGAANFVNECAQRITQETLPQIMGDMKRQTSLQLKFADQNTVQAQINELRKNIKNKPEAVAVLAVIDQKLEAIENPQNSFHV